MSLALSISLKRGLAPLGPLGTLGPLGMSLGSLGEELCGASGRLCWLSGRSLRMLERTKMSFSTTCSSSTQAGRNARSD